MESDGRGEERRLHRRVPTAQRCWCESSSTSMYVMMMNLSSGGAFLRTAVPLPVGNRAVLRWKLPDETPVEADALVVWASHGGPGGGVPGMGLRFESLRQTDGKLESYIIEQSS